MGLGAGLITGREVDLLVGLRPGDAAYDNHTGFTYHPQDESNTDENVAFYESGAVGDQLDFDVGPYIGQMETPMLVLQPIFGAVDYDVIERTTDQSLISEYSGFASNVWPLDISPTDGSLRLEVANNDSGVDGTEAGWYPYAALFDLQE